MLLVYCILKLYLDSGAVGACCTDQDLYFIRTRGRNSITAAPQGGASTSPTWELTD